MKVGRKIKNIKGYVNLKTDLDLIKINLKVIETKLRFLNKEKEDLLIFNSDLNDIYKKYELKLQELNFY